MSIWRMHLAPRGLCAAMLGWLASAACAVVLPGQLNATLSEPRAFGYQIGDIVSRTVTVDASDGLVLDESSVPQAGARGNALELRSVEQRSSVETGGRRHELTLAYQVFLSPPESRTLEMPGFTLRFQGQPRAQEVHVEAWPVTVSPLVPVEVSPRRGLGELQPDTPPPLIDTRFARWRLIGYGIVSLVLLAYLAHVYIGLPWWTRAHRPFTLAWRAMHGLTPASSDSQRRDAFKHLHEALNRTMGEVVFEERVDRFVRAQPHFAHLRDDLVRFFRQSRQEFFGSETHEGDQVPAHADRSWLLEFCRRCRDAERGSP
jgi:mxaA protein